MYSVMVIQVDSPTLCGPPDAVGAHRNDYLCGFENALVASMRPVADKIDLLLSLDLAFLLPDDTEEGRTGRTVVIDSPENLSTTDDFDVNVYDEKMDLYLPQAHEFFYDEEEEEEKENKEKKEDKKKVIEKNNKRKRDE